MLWGTFGTILEALELLRQSSALLPRCRSFLGGLILGPLQFHCFTLYVHLFHLTVGNAHLLGVRCGDLWHPVLAS